MVKTKYKYFLLEKLVDGELKYYVYDWDDNVLVMSTLIHYHPIHKHNILIHHQLIFLIKNIYI